MRCRVVPMAANEAKSSLSAKYSASHDQARAVKLTTIV